DLLEIRKGQIAEFLPRQTASLSLQTAEQASEFQPKGGSGELSAGLDRLGERDRKHLLLGDVRDESANNRPVLPKHSRPAGGAQSIQVSPSSTEDLDSKRKLCDAAFEHLAHDLSIAGVSV